MELPLDMVRCELCGAIVESTTDDGHAYIPGNPGCWRFFTLVQADEYTRFRYPKIHRVVVDAYMAQHPGDGADRRERQSVTLHLAALYASLELKLPPREATDYLYTTMRKNKDYDVLTPRESVGDINITYLKNCATEAEYTKRATEWAWCVWNTWEHEQDRIRSMFIKGTEERV